MKELKKILKKLKQADWDLMNALVASFSLLVAYRALVFSAEESRRSAALAEKTSAPVLQFNIGAIAPIDKSSDFSFIGLEVENVGGGPAFIMPIKFRFWNGAEVVDNGDASSTRRMMSYVPKDFSFKIVHGRVVLKPGDRLKLVWLDKSRLTGDFKKDSVYQTLCREFIENNEVYVCYASLYGKVSGVALTSYKNRATRMADINKRCRCGTIISIDSLINQ